MKDDRVVLVTGAQIGIGAATAIAFGRLGASVVVNWLDDEAAAQRVCQAVEQAGGRALPLQCDVGVSDRVEAMFAAIGERFGRLDVLVNNAGIFPRRAFLELTDDEWDEVMNVNLKGSFRCARAAARMMVAAGRGGCIVSVSSQAVRGKVLGVHYSASKGGMMAMTRSIALELAPHRIRVNAVAPGITDTAQPRVEHSEARMRELSAEVPLGRMASPEEVANVIVFLASDAASQMTGQTLFVNGGSYMP